MYKKTNEILDNFFLQKPYRDLLFYMKVNQDAGSDNIYLNHIAPARNALGYTDEKKEQFEKLYTDLIDCGYMSKKEKSGQLYITKDGRDFLQNYARFKALGVTAKFTEIFKRNFTGIVSLLAVIISVVSLIVSICK